MKQCKFVKNCELLGGMEVLVCSDVCMGEAASLIGVKQCQLNGKICAGEKNKIKQVQVILKTEFVLLGLLWDHRL